MRFLLFFILCVASTNVYSIEAVVGHTLYYSARSGTYIPSPQLYWQIKNSSVRFVTTPDSTIVAKIRTDIVFADDEGIVKEDHFILQTPPRTDVAGIASVNVLKQKRFDIDLPVKGKLRYFLTLTDMNDSSNKFTFTDSFDVHFEATQPFFSGLKLLDVAASEDGKKEIDVPLCANFYDNYRRAVYYSADLYNIKKVAKANYPLMRRVKIGKKPNEALSTDFMRVDTITNEKQLHLYGSMPIGTLRSGNYYISLSLEDKNGYPLASNNMFIQRLNMHPDEIVAPKVEIKEIMTDTAMESVTVLNLEKTFIAKYDMKQLRAILKMLLPVSDPMQTNTINAFLKKPDEMYTRYFIYNYFQAINAKDPEAAWKDYSDKVVEVNKKYNSQGTAGYETERGFIYLRYGKPTDIVTVTAESGSLPYEIWQYNVLTQFSNNKMLDNALFLFYKPTQTMADYRLLHSTVTGEVINMSWRSYLFSTGNGASSAGFNMNARAEQYFGNR